MPLKVVLQTADGKRLDEIISSSAPLSRLIPLGDPTFPLLQYIDPYGNTIFNGNQMQSFLPEWDLATKQITNQSDIDLMLRIRSLAERCKQEPHLFLRFIGD